VILHNLRNNIFECFITMTRHRSARDDKAKLSTYRVTEAKHVKRSNGASFRISLMQPYLFLSRDGVDGVHALAKCVGCLHACCTDAHPGSWCRGAVLLREDGWLRRRHWLPALAFEGRWWGGRRRRRQWRRQVASSYQMLAISFRRAVVGLHDLWFKMLFFSYYELSWWEVLTRILHFPLYVSTLSAQHDQDWFYFNLCKNIQLRDKNTVHTDTGLLCDM